MNKKILLIIFICFTFCFTISCKKCDKTIDNNKDCLHELVEWHVIEDSTCTKLGKKEQRCISCNYVLTTSIIGYKEHKEIIVEGKNATCTEEGYTDSIKCGECNTILENSNVIPAINHNYKIDSDNSTDKLIVYKCINCNDSYEKEVINSSICDNGHVESEWIIITESTCTTYGVAHILCVNCEIELEIKTLPLNEHTEEVILGYKETCTMDGLTDGLKCSICDKVLLAQEVITKTEHNYVITYTLNPTRDTDGYNEYTCSNCKDSYKTVIPATGYYDESQPVSIYLKDNDISIINDNSGVLVDNNNVKIILAGEYDIYGELTEGMIHISVDDESKVILNLYGVKITSSLTNPIYIESGNKVEISSKNETVNYINDTRSSITTDMVGGAIYSLVDLELKGKGELYVTSTYNNGIATTKDLEIKNVTLEVNAPNNAIKGNDSIIIESGTIKAISSSGDALKTENSDISEKGNQRGTITILDGIIDLFAACDGIDAAYDCVIEGGTINIYTESYSKYSGEVTQTSATTVYLRISSRAGSLANITKYSAMFITENSEIRWVDGVYQSSNGKKYYKFSVPSGVSYVKFYAYLASQNQSQSSSYSFVTDQMTIPTVYDTYYITSASALILNGSWENYSAPTGGMGGPGRPGGGMMEGNPNSATYSCKGIKSDNTITINGGTIKIKSHDDGIHTNGDVLLDNGNYGSANISINGGSVNVYSDDDGLHADGTLTVSDGNLIINNSYEGIEGNYIYFKGGTIQIKSLDDGINAKTNLYFQGSNVYLDAGGDGIDSNGNIYMSAGVVLALGPTNGGNGVIDYGDRNCTFSFTGGLLLAMGCSGMNAKPTASTGNTVFAITTTSPSTSSYLTITSNGLVVAVLKVTKANQNYRVLAYNNNDYPSTTVSVSNSTSYTLTNELYYIV